MIKKIALIALRWASLLAASSWKTAINITTSWPTPLSTELEAHRMMINRGLIFRYEMNKKLSEAEGILEKDALSVVTAQDYMNKRVQEKCWKVLVKCMARKESIDMYALSMFDYLLELRDIVLQIEFINSFYTEAGEDVILERDEYADKAMDMLYKYEMQHNLKDDVYNSIYFKYGFSEFDDYWVYRKKEVINENKACSLIQYCLDGFENIRKKFPITILRIGILNNAADLIMKSKLASNEMSILNTITDYYIRFKARKEPFEGEATFFDVDYNNLKNKDIKKAYRNNVKSKILPLLPLYFPSKQYTKFDKLTSYIEAVATKIYKFITNTSFQPVLSPHLPVLELREFVDYLYKTTAYFPPYLNSYFLLYDQKFETSNDDLKIEIHFFKNVKIYKNNKVVLELNDFYINSTKMLDETGWSLDDVASFAFTNLFHTNSPYVKIIVEYSVDKETLTDLKILPGIEDSYIVTLKTPAAIRKVLPAMVNTGNIAL